MIGACRRPESGMGRVYTCVRSVGATCRSASPESGVRVSPSAPSGAVVFNSQHSGLLIRTVRVRIPPAPPNFPRSLRTARLEIFSSAEYLSRETLLSHDVPEQPRDQPAKLRFAGASPAVVSTFGAVVPIAARRTCNAEETERNRPAPPVCSRGVPRCTAVFQTAGADALPASSTIRS
jgi:hypothetical protein